jgi:O-antigen/teichoic acid export membrane protein
MSRRLRHLARNLGSVVAANAVSAGLGFLVLALLSRQLSPAGFGVLAPIISVLDLGQVLIDSIVAAGAVHVAVQKLKSNPAHAAMAFKIAFCIRMGAAGIVVALGWPAAPWLSDLLFGSAAWTAELRLACMAVPAIAVYMSAISVLQSRQDFARLSVLTVYKNALRLAFLVVLAVAGMLSIDAAVWAICLAAAGAAVLAVLTAPFGYLRVPGIDRTIAGEMFAVNKWMMIMMIGYVGGRIDVFMLSGLSVAEQVGWYSAAFQLCLAITLVSQSLLTTLFPKTSGLQTPAEMRAYWNRSLKLSLVVIVPYGLLLALSSWITPLLLGEPYANAAPVLNLLAGSAFLTLATNPAILLLFPLGEVRVLALAGLAQLAIRIVLNLFFMPVYGATGAAGAELLAKVVTIGLTLIIIDRVLRSKQRADEASGAARPAIDIGAGAGS